MNKKHITLTIIAVLVSIILIICISASSSKKNVVSTTPVEGNYNLSVDDLDFTSVSVPKMTESKKEQIVNNALMEKRKSILEDCKKLAKVLFGGKKSEESSEPKKENINTSENLEKEENSIVTPTPTTTTPTTETNSPTLPATSKPILTPTPPATSTPIPTPTPIENSYIEISKVINGEKKQSNYTNKIEELGIPLEAKYPSINIGNCSARNVWDMQLFNNRIYIGSGDYGRNKGPVDVYYYDVETEKFVKDGTLQDEQINRFIIINGQLCTPGIDPMKGWDKGSFYRLENNSWVEYRTIPNGVHNFDMVECKGNIFMGVGTETYNNIALSKDNGNTFELVKMNLQTGITMRVYDLVVLKDKVYGLVMRRVKEDGVTFEVYEYDEENNSFEYNPEKYAFIVSNEKNGFAYNACENVVFITKKMNYKDNIMFINGGMSYTNNLCDYTNVIPDTVEDKKYTYIYDAIEKDGVAYILCATNLDSTKTSAVELQKSNTWINSVYKSTDLKNWELELYFEYDDPARSFEYSNGEFYFGMGKYCRSENEKLFDLTYIKNNGRILKIKK